MFFSSRIVLLSNSFNLNRSEFLNCGSWRSVFLIHFNQDSLQRSHPFFLKVRLKILSSNIFPSLVFFFFAIMVCFIVIVVSVIHKVC